jgi:hypothetical protein
MSKAPLPNQQIISTPTARRDLGRGIVASIILALGSIGGGLFPEVARSQSSIDETQIVPTKKRQSKPTAPSVAPDNTNTAAPTITPATAPKPPATNNEPAPSGPNVDSAKNGDNLALTVRCQDSSTIVQKGRIQAALFNWRTNYFGRDYTPAKRCTIVSNRLQTAADKNGGTLQGLSLSGGKLNNQPVICILQTNEDKCSDRNLLFTLKPENARQIQATIDRIVTFAQDGSTSVEESAKSTTTKSRSSADLGAWERRVFSGSIPKRIDLDMGF